MLIGRKIELGVIVLILLIGGLAADDDQPKTDGVAKTGGISPGEFSHKNKGSFAMEYQVVKLEPESVAYHKYIGDDPAPEDRAMEAVLNWAQKTGVLPDVVRFYIVRAARGDQRGYEAWLPIGDVRSENGDIEFKETSGGLYALRKGRQPWGEGILKAMGNIEKTFGPWLEEHGYERDRKRPPLQEHLVGAGFVGRPFQEDPGFRIVFYIPIREIGDRDVEDENEAPENYPWPVWL